jgi:hypothetical protein
MSKVKELHLSVAYTYQPAAYHSAKGEASMTVIVEDGDDVDVVAEEMRQELTQQLVFNLAGIEVVHDKIGKQGMDVQDLVDEINHEPSIMEEAEDGDWDGEI